MQTSLINSSMPAKTSARWVFYFIFFADDIGHQGRRPIRRHTSVWRSMRPLNIPNPLPKPAAYVNDVYRTLILQQADRAG